MKSTGRESEVPCSDAIREIHKGEGIGGCRSVKLWRSGLGMGMAAMFRDDQGVGGRRYSKKFVEIQRFGEDGDIRKMIQGGWSLVWQCSGGRGCSQMRSGDDSKMSMGMMMMNRE